MYTAHIIKLLNERKNIVLKECHTVDSCTTILYDYGHVDDKYKVRRMKVSWYDDPTEHSQTTRVNKKLVFRDIFYRVIEEQRYRIECPEITISLMDIRFILKVAKALKNNSVEELLNESE